MLVLLASGHLPLRAADDDEDEKVPPLPKAVAEVARRYAGIVEWRGFFDASTTGSSSKASDHFAQSRYFEARTQGHFTLKQSENGWDPKRARFQWGESTREEVGEATGSEFDQWSQRDVVAGTSTEWTSELGGTQPLAGVEFSIDLLKQSGGVHMGFVPGGKQLKRTQTGEAVVAVSRGDGQKRFETRPLDEVNYKDLNMPHLRMGFAEDEQYRRREWETVRGGPGVLAFTYERTEPPDADNRYNAPRNTYRSRIILFPVYDDLELEVTIDGYAKWRPEGSIEKPQEPGNSVVARATLKSKTGKVKTLPDVKRFTFELLDTSREPGVCLNWPLGAKDDAYDLRLVAEFGGKLSNAEQKLIVTDQRQDEKAQPIAETRINSFDFGGRATLQITCELEDGRELMGLMKEGGEQELVRLPKMVGPGWIAEAWRKAKQAEKLADNDDNEKVAGQTGHGDGFTLYEEYRGWLEKGKHVEGDPKKKDFFVRNTIGADAKGGIALFERVSQLAVHSRLRASEFSREERLMNGNRRDAPQRVKQHGVFLENTEGQGSFGGGTAGMTKADADYAFRPGKVWQVRVEYPTSRDGLFSKARSAAYNLSERDAAVAYDRGVAHELLHSVGVDHHGTVGYGWMRYFQSATDPGNPTHRARFVDNPPGKDDNNLTYGPYSRTMTPETLAKDLMRAPSGTLLWEDTGQDIAESMAAAFERALAAQRAARAANPPSVDPGERATRFPYYGKDAHFWRESEIFDSTVQYGPQFQLYLTIEEPGQSCSGDELCLMRYYFANAYPAKELKDTYYVVRPGPGANRAGLELCRSPAGTFHNAATNNPRPRFGDAAEKRGECFRYICPNDAIAPRKL